MKIRHCTVNNTTLYKETSYGFLCTDMVTACDVTYSIVFI